MTRTYHVLSLGAGVQSTTLYLLDWLPGYDAAIFADTGDEPEKVYGHLAWLESLGRVPILNRSLGVKLGDCVARGENSTGQKFIPIPAYTPDEAGRVGLTRRQCTAEFKLKVVERSIRRDLLQLKPRQRFPKGVRVVQYLGLSADEAGRAARVQRRYADHPWASVRFPLIERGWSREDCRLYLADKVPHPVPRSACVFCPYKTSREWADLKANDAAGWARAVEIDHAMREHDPKLFLHAKCIPLDVIDFGAEPPATLSPMTTNECMGMCGV